MIAKLRAWWRRLRVRLWASLIDGATDAEVERLLADVRARKACRRKG